MENKVEERKRTNTRALYEAVTRFIDDNRHSNDVNVRWLSSLMEPNLPRICDIMNNRVPKTDKEAIAAFRSAEINAEIASRRKDIERLESDLATISKGEG